jgi:arylformamidase
MIEYRGNQYDQAEFDRQFNPRLTADDPDSVQPRRAALSEALRARRAHVLGLKYGEREREFVDVFPADAPDAPVLVYFHGGYWRTGSARENNYMAEPFVDAGACVAVVNYDLCPTVSLATVVAQARTAIGWIAQNIGDHGGDASRLFLLGHSAGAHLVAMALADDSGSVPHDAIIGAAVVAGIYDLDPVVRAAVNEEIGVKPEEVGPFSPLSHPPRVPLPLIVAVGLAESEEWVRQSRLYEDAAKAAGCDVARIDFPDGDHYRPLFDMIRADDPLRLAILARMGLA